MDIEISPKNKSKLRKTWCWYYTKWSMSYLSRYQKWYLKILEACQNLSNYSNRKIKLIQKNIEKDTTEWLFLNFYHGEC